MLAKENLSKRRMVQLNTYGPEDFYIVWVYVPLNVCMCAPMHVHTPMCVLLYVFMCVHVCVCNGYCTVRTRITSTISPNFCPRLSIQVFWWDVINLDYFLQDYKRKTAFFSCFILIKCEPIHWDILKNTDKQNKKTNNILKEENIFKC
jgi:hypothetical protein